MTIFFKIDNIYVLYSIRRFYRLVMLGILIIVKIDAFSITLFHYRRKLRKKISIDPEMCGNFEKLANASKMNSNEATTILVQKMQFWLPPHAFNANRQFFPQFSLRYGIRIVFAISQKSGNLSQRRHRRKHKSQRGAKEKEKTFLCLCHELHF